MAQAREAAQWIYKHSLCKLKDLSVVLRTNGRREPSPGSCTLTSTHIPILTHIHYTHKHIHKNIFINVQDYQRTNMEQNRVPPQ